VKPQNLDAGLLMWNMRRRIASRLPARRVVVGFHFTGAPTTYRGARKFWLVLDRTGIDLCVHDPGFDVDVYVEADLAAIASVWLGDVMWSTAVHAQKILLSGTPAFIRQLPSWLLLSPFAAVPRPSGTERSSTGAAYSAT
jgi:hypothetical protein